MQAMVNSGQRISQQRPREDAQERAAAPIRSHSADSTAARKMPVPVADSQLKLVTPAFSRSSRLSGHLAARAAPTLLVQAGHRDVDRHASASCSCLERRGRPQTNTNTVSSSHGTQAASDLRRACSVDGARLAAGVSSAKRQRRPRLPDLQEQRQAHQRDQPAGHVHQPGAVVVGDGELHQRRSCRRRPAAPARPPSDARQPAITHTSHAGTSSEKNGSCRPAIGAELAARPGPVTLASVMIGVPSAPKATGEVLASSARPAACSGLEAGPDQQRRRDGHRRAEPGRPLDEGPEAEGDQQRLDAAVVGQRQRRSA